MSNGNKNTVSSDFFIHVRRLVRAVLIATYPVCILLVTIKWKVSWCISRGYRLEFPNKTVFLSMKIVYIYANSADPDEMPNYAGFHLGLHCLTKYLFLVCFFFFFFF